LTLKEGLLFSLSDSVIGSLSFESDILIYLSWLTPSTQYTFYNSECSYENIPDISVLIILPSTVWAIGIPKFP